MNIRLVVLISLMVSIAACGGGGSGGSGDAPPSTASNQAPSAAASASLNNAYSSQVVSLDASGSSDTDGSISSYLWEQISGPSVDLISANSATANFTVPPLSQEGQVSLRVTVTDDDGGTDTAVITVNVSAAPVLVTAVIADGKSFGVDDSPQSLSVSALEIEGSGEVVSGASLTWESDLQELAAADLTVGFSFDAALIPGQHNLTLTVDAGAYGITTHAYSFLVRPRFWPLTTGMATSATEAQRVAPILLITHIPTEDGVSLDTQEANYSVRPPEWGGDTVDDIVAYVQTIAERTRFFLEERTKFRGYKNTTSIPYAAYEVVAHIVFYEAVPRSDRPNPFDLQQLMIDYERILEKAGARQFIEELGVQDVWLANYFNEEFQVWESNMSSPSSADISNSDRFESDLPLYDTTYIVYGINYHRTQAEAIHNYGHQTEAMLDYIDRRASGSSELFWGSFVGIPGFPGPQMQLGRCGWSHMPPNTNVDYDYNNLTLQESDCEDWRPDNTGEKTTVNAQYFSDLAYDWPGTDDIPQKAETQFYLWWMQNMPGLANNIPYNDTVMSNWWRILTDWDQAIAENAKLYVDGKVPGSNTATIINNFGDASIRTQDGSLHTFGLNETLDLAVNENGTTVELFSCGWEIDLYPPNGCRFIPYTLFPGETWQIISTQPAPRIILERIESQPDGAFRLSLSSPAPKTLRFDWVGLPEIIEYRLFEQATESAGFEQIATIAAGEESFSMEVFLPDKADASFFVQACDVTECVDSDVVSAQSALTNAIGYFKASNTGGSDHFGGRGDATNVLEGRGVALAADGQTMVIGAPGEDSGATGINGDQLEDSQPDSGAVYVFNRIGPGEWRQSHYIKASNTDAGDGFGSDVALSGDGRTLVVSAPGEASDATGMNGDQSSNAKPGSGAVYVFVKNDANDWQQQMYLKASNPEDRDISTDMLTDSFGSSLALSADGNTLAVGAPGMNDSVEDPDNSRIFLFPDVGRTFVYVRDDAGNWSEQFAFRSLSLFAQAGTSVDLSADGNVLATGYAREENSAVGIDGPCCDRNLPASGAVRVFSRDITGNWTQETYIKASNPGFLDRFGTTVALSGNGSTLAVGAIGEGSGASGINGDQFDDSSPNSGAVYIFDRENTSWIQRAFVKPSNTTLSQTFGADLAFTSDGTRLVVGSPLEISNARGIDGDDANRSASGAGAVYLFESDSVGTWSQIRYIKSSNTGFITGENDNFGIALDISDDGSILAVGASGEDSSSEGIGGDQQNNNTINSGAVYIY